MVNTRHDLLDLLHNGYFLDNSFNFLNFRIVVVDCDYLFLFNLNLPYSLHNGRNLDNLLDYLLDILVDLDDFGHNLLNLDEGRNLDQFLHLLFNLIYARNRR
jgi:hypothetical protein